MHSRLLLTYLLFVLMSGHLMAELTTPRLGIPPTNEIWYRTNTDSVLDLNASSWPTAITSHTYHNGKGVIRFRSALTKVPLAPFQGMTELTEISLPDKVATLESWTFAQCTNLQRVELPAGLSVWDKAFIRDVTHLDTVILRGPTKITLPIDQYFTPGSHPTFVACDLHKFLDDPQWAAIPFWEHDAIVHIIDHNAYALNSTTNTAQLYCTNERAIILPYFLQLPVAYQGHSYQQKECHAGALRHNQKLEELTIESGWGVSINSYTFYGCTNLRTVRISHAQAMIGKMAFGECYQAAFDIDPNNVYYGSTIRKDTSNAVIYLATRSLLFGSSATNLIERIQYIDDSAFVNNPYLDHLVLPSTLLRIGAGAFAHTSTTKITSHSLTPPVLQETTFEGVSRDIPVFVPYKALEAYQAAPYWSDFTNLDIFFNPGDTIVVRPEGASFDLYYEVLSSHEVALVAPHEGYPIVPFGTLQIPDSITAHSYHFDVVHIADDALRNTNLQSLNLGANVRRIGTHALADNGILAAINLSQVDTLDALAFAHCERLRSLTLPATVSHIASHPQGPITAGCTALTDMVVALANPTYYVSDSAHAILRRADSTLVVACPTTRLTTEVARLAEGAMRSVGITSITLPSTITYIGANALDSLFTHLESRAILPPQLTDVSAYGDSLLQATEVIIPLEAMPLYSKDQQWQRFSRMAERRDTIYVRHRVPEYVLPFLVYPDEEGVYAATLQAPIVKPMGDVVLPDSLMAANGKYYPLTTLEDRVLSYCSDLTSITLPATLRRIYDFALSGCTNLQSVHIPAGVDSIADHAFRSDLKIATITVDSANRTYDSRSNCNAIIRRRDQTLFIACRNSTVPEGVERIAFATFDGLAIKSVTLPTTLRSLDDRAFSGCRQLTEIRFCATTPPSLGGKTHTFEGVNTSIPVYVPNHCLSAYTADTVGAPLRAFRDVREWYNIGDTILERHPAGAYTSAYTLYYITREDSSAILIEQPAGTGWRTHANGDLILSDIIGWRYRLTEIAPRVLMNCNNLRWLELSEHITALGDSALMGCTGLERIVCHAIIPPAADSTTFLGMDMATPVQVPEGTRDLYKLATGWRNFECFQDPQPVPPPTPEGWYAPAAAPAPRKILRDGHVLILRNNQIYDLLGR